MSSNCCFVKKCYEENDPYTVWVPERPCACKKNKKRWY